MNLSVKPRILLLIAFGFLILLVVYQNQVLSKPTKENSSAIYVNSNGNLVVEGQQIWSRSTFEQLGYTYYKDVEVYVSEGVLARNSSDFDEAIMDDGDSVLYFEIRGGRIYRGVIVSNKVPVVVGPELHKLTIGTRLSELVSVLGSYEMLSGESSGVYIVFKKANNISFHTECSFYPEELTAKQRKMTREELFEECTVDSILFSGDKGRIWTTEGKRGRKPK